MTFKFVIILVFRYLFGLIHRLHSAFGAPFDNANMFIGISSCLEFTAGASTISKIVIILVSRYHFGFDPWLGLAMLICLLVYPIALVYHWWFYTCCIIFITANNIFFVMISLYLYRNMCYINRTLDV